MEYSLNYKEVGHNFWASSNPDIPMVVDDKAIKQTENQPINMSEMMGLDGYGAWCNITSSNNSNEPSYKYSSHPFIASNHDCCDRKQPNCVFPTVNVYGSPVDATTDDYDGCGMFVQSENSVPGPVGNSVVERMVGALSVFKESSGGGILAQVWVPVRSGDHYILSTSEQPYLLDEMLLGYREVSRSYTFSIEQKPGSFPGLPGRVFMSKMPEWTSNVSYYSSAEYLRVQHARHHQVRGSVALPIFTQQASCCAVLELVTVTEKSNFHFEIDSLCRALEAVDLRTTKPPRLLSQCFSPNQKTALAEITDVLRAVCNAHRLPLALTWIPCTFEEGDGYKIFQIQVKDNSLNLNKKSVLCIEETACYVNDKHMQEFVHACGEHFLEEGQGVAGKALQTNRSFFFCDVKNYHISEYPHVLHARKFGLNAAVAIRLRSTYTGVDDYILEFFLPPNINENKEQQLLLDSLSGTIQRVCKSLRTVSDAELVDSIDPKDDPCGVSQSLFTNDRPLTQEGSNGSRQSLDRPMIVNDCIKEDGYFEQASGLSRPIEKKRSTAEKTVSLGVLQKYFSGSLKNAAKSIGVCPTTLKRICRQHGISRWPSRKINKVNRSLRKIQTVLDSVQGVGGGLKFDLTTGELVAGCSVNQNDSCTIGNHFVQENHTQKRKKSSKIVQGAQHNLDFSSGLLHNQYRAASQTPHYMTPYETENDDKVIEHNQATTSGMTDSSNASGSMSSSPISIGEQRLKKDKTNNEDPKSRITIKATYKEDTVRFKFEPSAGCHHLYEEVAKRFEIQRGTFQLKYVDDEDEWVMLVSDLDLQECLEIMECLGKNSIKFLVRDLGFGMGSLVGSNRVLPGSC
ncbi:protein NLP9-like [Amaranthus tricolor]|uniref:protein NLP9-like n=1 Tax=Amaranthus tricolor TaxID=29722 RepID=UPI00258A0B45|nr:protein NLP9-like [Amaranthus tricolor]XP_057542835.1 protein NLP9-like [Amaranthus tricolor]